MPRKRSDRRQPGYIIGALLLFSVAVTWIDAVVQPPYFSKIPIKILFFLALPLLYLNLWPAERADFRKFFRFDVRGLRFSAILAVGIYGIIAGGYYFTRTIFDYSAVTRNLTSGMGITADNFLTVAIYITVINSLLEEVFFRGFGFMTLKKHIGRSAGLISPILFAVYHVGMTANSYPPLLLTLMLMGLIIGGMIFDALSERFGTLCPSWFVHLAADAAIMTVGANLFGLL